MIQTIQLKAKKVPASVKHNGRLYKKCRVGYGYPPTTVIIVEVYDTIHDEFGFTIGKKNVGQGQYSCGKRIVKVTKDSVRCFDMAEHYKKYGWAKSFVSNDDAIFFKLIEVDPEKVGTTSATGSDIFYYDVERCEPCTGGVREIEKIDC